MGELKDSGEPAGVIGGLRGLADKALGLRGRIRKLEEEVQECRELNLRLAELMDIVTELLVPIAERDEDRIHEVLERYHRAL